MADKTVKTKTAKSVKSKPLKSSESAKTRKVKTARYKSFKLSKRIKVETHKTIPSGWQLLKRSLSFVKLHWRLFVGIAAVYLGLNLLLGRGLSGINLDDVIFDIKNDPNVQTSGLGLGISLFGYLISSGGASTQAGSIYQTMLAIIVSLVTIWAMRQTMAGKKPTIKQAYYLGTGALIPFVLVLLVVGLQLLPMVIGGWIYGNIVGGGIATSMVEKVAWTGLFFLLSVLTLYMICSSLFALYIVNLPGVKPMQALRSARQLVIHRRFMILRKLIFLPFALILLGALILIPLLIVTPTLAAWLYIVLSAMALVVTHVYMYSFYRELL
jgi:hypothetical protein